MAFERQCIAFYVHRYGEILFEGACHGDWRAAESGAMQYLTTLFSAEGDPSELVDRPILDAIQKDVFRLAEEVRIMLFVDLSA